MHLLHSLEHPPQMQDGHSHDVAASRANSPTHNKHTMNTNREEAERPVSHRPLQRQRQQTNKQRHSSSTETQPDMQPPHLTGWFRSLLREFVPSMSTCGQKRTTESNSHRDGVTTNDERRTTTKNTTNYMVGCRNRQKGGKRGVIPGRPDARFDPGAKS